ncbi:MAG: hypothetical protein R3C49_08370 [Planctomycetaceae bacterium]
MLKHVRQVFAVCGMLFVLSLSTASACPNCKFANETEADRPRAYMYSILFMLGMPATIFTGFGISFYRMAKKNQQQADEAALESSDASSV